MPLLEPNAPVELILKQRKDKSQYIEVWVRSKARPEVQRATIVERTFGEAALVEVAAAAIMETFWTSRSNEHDPSEIARVAREAYLQLNTTDPRPTFGNEAAIES